MTDQEFKVSIHAPTRGATYTQGLFDGRNLVSIHAPTRGATSDLLTHSENKSRFNPRAHAGRDLDLPPLLDLVDLFQSTRPRGARL